MLSGNRQPGCRNATWLISWLGRHMEGRATDQNIKWQHQYYWWWLGVWRWLLFVTLDISFCQFKKLVDSFVNIICNVMNTQGLICPKINKLNYMTRIYCFLNATMSVLTVSFTQIWLRMYNKKCGSTCFQSWRSKIMFESNADSQKCDEVWSWWGASGCPKWI